MHTFVRLCDQHCLCDPSILGLFAGTWSSTSSCSVVNHVTVTILRLVHENSAWIIKQNNSKVMLKAFLNSHAYKPPLLTNNKHESKVITSFWHPCCNSEKSFFTTPDMLKEPLVTTYSAINNSLCLLIQIKNIKWKLLRCLTFTNCSKYSCLFCNLFLHLTPVVCLHLVKNIVLLSLEPALSLCCPFIQDLESRGIYQGLQLLP